MGCVRGWARGQGLGGLRAIITNMEMKIPPAPIPAIALAAIKNGMVVATPQSRDPISKMQMTARLNPC